MTSLWPPQGTKPYDGNLKQLWNVGHADTGKHLGARNVLEYGAKGDGAADDTAAINAAIAAMGATYPGGLYLPGGIYKISSKLLLPAADGGKVFGDGRSTIIVPANGTSDDILAVRGARWKIADLAIHGNSSNQSQGHAITSSGGYCWFEDIYIDNPKQDGIHLTGAGVGSNLLRGVQMLNCQQYGIYLGPTCFDNEIVGCLIGSSGAHNVFVGAGFNRFTATHVYSAGVGGGSGFYLDSHVNYVQLVNCVSESNLLLGILLNLGNQGIAVIGGSYYQNGQQAVYMNGALNCSISGAAIFNNGIGTPAAGITGDATSVDVSVQGCNFFDNQGTKTQTYAVETKNSSDRWMFHGNSMKANQHRTGSTSLVGSNNLPATISQHNQV